MQKNTPKLYVITGGPGAGKTTLLHKLHQYGYQTVPEEAREIIKIQMETQGNALPWADKALYAKLMGEASFNTYQKVKQTLSNDDIIFFDRGILDTLCYVQLENIPVWEELLSMCENVHYQRQVFILPPWKDIYTNDKERKQLWKEAVLTFNRMAETYTNYGYHLEEVPRDTVEKRAAFILDKIAAG